MNCPNCNIELTSACEKVEFEDTEGNVKVIGVTAHWCIACGYENIY